ncbi:MAG TPA: ABC transporter permease [Puia sp.]|nr:ABC transporter permease [Puia sp.]
MFKNYCKTAWRTIKGSKVYSGINILGLAAGMAVALLIGLWVYNEYSYDRWLPGYQQLYQVKMNFTNDGQTHTQDAVSLPIAGILRSNIPGVAYVAECDWMDAHNLAVGDKKLYLGGAMIGSDFLKMFRYPLLKGNAGACMTDPNSIVLTQSTATALFGKEDPMNKMVRVDNSHDLKVTGILKDVPKNSSLQFQYLIPFSFAEATQDWMKNARTTWTNNSFQLFVALEPNADFAQIAPKVKDIVKQNSPEMRRGKPELLLHPLKDWRLYSEFKDGKAAGGFIDYVRMFSIIGGLVLLIACINFMNLSTARSEKRAREVGVRKAIGSQRKDLIFQFLIESVVITLVSFIVALLLVELALPYFNTLTNSAIQLPFRQPAFWGLMAGYVLLTGLLAGGRPAFYLSSFQPVKVLKGAIHTGRAASLPRRILVVLQFTCSIGLIISTIIIYQQIQHAKDRPSGYNPNRLMSTDMSADLNKNFSALRNDLLQSGIAVSVASATSPITNLYSHSGLNDWPGRGATDERLSVGAVSISENYFSTLGMQLVAGRDFTGDYHKDSADVILNESAVKRIKLKQPIGQVIAWNNDEHVRIIGVAKDAIMESPFTPVTPTVFYASRWKSNLLYRLAADVKTQDALVKLTALFSKYNPAYPYIYQFVDAEYARKFDMELLIGKLAGLFAGLAIFISCLGLFGLAAYMAEQRSKEIGIRKVLGATIPQLWLLLSRDFLLLVIISCFIASPVAWYYLQHWLQGYDYRITIGPGVFILAGVLAIVITLLTVSFQAIRAALTNPTQSLRNE